jgi:hypothetical protein
MKQQLVLIEKGVGIQVTARPNRCAMQHRVRACFGLGTVLEYGLLTRSLAQVSAVLSVK